jgi:hypothetical protein
MNTLYHTFSPDCLPIIGRVESTRLLDFGLATENCADGCSIHQKSDDTALTLGIRESRDMVTLKPQTLIFESCFGCGHIVMSIE